MRSSHAAPPQTLGTPLELDPADWGSEQNYFVLSGLVIPRPIAWVSTLSPAGVPNLAPYSYFNLVCSNPPHAMFSSDGVKDSLRNIRASGEFVLNLASVELAEPLNFSATDFPPEESEFSWSGLTPAPSARVKPPRVAQAKAHLECRFVREVPIGGSFVVFGSIVHIHVDPTIWRAGRVDARLLDPLCRLSGAGYASLGELFKVERPRWKDVAGSAAAPRIPRRKETK
jgi:flavin reductase (DIM6/NTAB) family NADH-FMN oxidoreductase RutF